MATDKKDCKRFFAKPMWVTFSFWMCSHRCQLNQQEIN